MQWDFRKVGELTLRQRLERIQKYKAKRDKRLWKAKVNYDIRQVLAKKRFRVKGKFVSNMNK